MLEIIIHSMEAVVALLVGVMAYRVHGLTNRYYQLENYSNAKGNDDDIQINELKSASEKPTGEDQSVIIRILKGRVTNNQSYETKIQVLQESQLFAGTQLVNIKRRFGDLDNNNLDWLREACALYLIGAIEHISSARDCHADSREELALLALKSSMGITKNEAYQFYYKAQRELRDTDAQTTLKSGAEAAKNWLKDQPVPKKLSLTNQLENWGVFA